MNNRKPTCMGTVRSSPSCIDLVIVSSSLAPIINSRTLEDTHGSNHFPILTELQTNRTTSINQSNFIKKYNFKKADCIL